jgi:hypothetical protein
MKSLFLLLIFNSLFSFFALSQKFPVSEIPDSLKENAKAVIRYQEEKLTILSKGKGRFYSKSVVTILDKKFEKFSNLYVPYTSLHKILSIKAFLYDANGKELRKVNQSDFSDISIADFELISDYRAKTTELSNSSTPYTIEFEYEIENDGLLFYHNWKSDLSEDVSIQTSKFIIEVPEELGFNKKEIGLPKNTIIREGKNNGKIAQSWEIQNLKTLQSERFISPLVSLEPRVMTVPKTFEIEKFEGEMKDWKSLGTFFYKLAKDRQKLPEETVAKVWEMTYRLKTDKEKIKVLYEYLQQNTRYVYIGLGIGGWQPIDAATVDRRKFGDCKALSNYMQALLSVVNIPSHYALINAGRGNKSFSKDLPNPYFNHAILCVPNNKDTVWLECTSQSLPFGFLGDFTDDREALLITEEGGKIVRTPKISIESNAQKRNIKLNVDKEGNGVFSYSSELKGLQMDDHLHLVNQSEENQKKWALEKFDFPNVKLNKVKFELLKEETPRVLLNIDGELKGIASKSGNRMFFKPYFLETFRPLEDKQKERNHDIWLDYGFSDIDTVEIVLPEGFFAEYLPSNVNLKEDFGNYQSDFQQEGSKVIITRRLQRKNGYFKKELYPKLKDFYKKVNSTDQQKIVLVNKT